MPGLAEAAGFAPAARRFSAERMAQGYLDVFEVLLDDDVSTMGTSGISSPCDTEELCLSW